jgi:hypothetical protein
MPLCLRLNGPKVREALWEYGHQRKEQKAMTDNTTIWRTLQAHLPKKTWIPLSDIFSVVEAKLPLDPDDLSSRGVASPRWKTNVRQVLKVGERKGSIRARKHDAGGSKREQNEKTAQ